MPCNMHDTSPLSEGALNSWGKLSERQLAAVLCGVITCFTSEEVFHHVDWKEVGVPEVLVREWWRKHQERDAQRREDEAQRARSIEAHERETLAALKAKYES